MRPQPVPRLAAPAAATAALALLALAGCGGGSGPAGGGEGAAAATIKIGVVGPMTGDQAKQGKDMKNGVDLAVSKWNAEKGGVLGKRLELLVEDDAQDPKQAVQVASKLRNQGVAGVVGHFNSSCTIPASDEYRKSDVVMITPASTNPQVTDRGYPNVFRVCGRDDQQGKVAAEYVAERMADAKVAIVHDKTTYGQGFADEFQKNYERLTGRKPVYYGGIVREDQDFTAVLTTMKSFEPRVVFFGGLYTQAALLVKQAKQLGIDARWLSGDGTYDPEYIRIAGTENAEGTLLTFIPDQTKIPTAQKVIEEYEKRYGEVGPYSIYSYTSAQILLEGIEKAGKVDGAEVAKAIHAATFDTPFGRIQFDAKGDVLESPYVVWEVRDGRFVQITGVGGGAAEGAAEGSPPPAPEASPGAAASPAPSPAASPAAPDAR